MDIGIAGQTLKRMALSSSLFSGSDVVREQVLPEYGGCIVTIHHASILWNWAIARIMQQTNSIKRLI